MAGFLSSFLCSCVTNVAYTAAAGKQSAAIITQATVDAAIQVAIALWQRNSSKSIQSMQQEIADAQVQLAEEVQAHAEIFWPEEKELIDDIFAESKVTTGYTALMAEFSGLASATLNDGRSRWVQTMRSLCMPPSRCEDARWHRNAAVIGVDLQNFAARQDEARTQIINDRRYARQNMALGLGRGQLQALLSYQDIGRIAGANAAGSLLATVNSAMQAYGYNQLRQDYTAWGSGIRDTWAKTYMPQGSPVERQPMPVNRVQVNDIVPVAAQPRIEQPVTKENEWDGLDESMREQYRFRGFN